MTSRNAKVFNTTIQNHPTVSLTARTQGSSSLAEAPFDLDEIRSVLNFNDLKVLTEFFENSGWTPIMELQLLLNIIKDPDTSHSVRLRALKDLDNRRDKLLELSGLVMKATKTTPTNDGGQTVLSTNVVAAALEGRKKVRSKEHEPDAATSATRSIPRPDGEDSGAVHEDTETPNEKPETPSITDISGRIPPNGSTATGDGPDAKPDVSAIDGVQGPTGPSCDSGAPAPARSTYSGFSKGSSTGHRPPAGKTDGGLCQGGGGEVARRKADS